MAQMMIPRIGFLSIKNNSRVVPRIFVPLKYQRLCFHTSWVFDVQGKSILMPSLSPTMEKGTIVKWFKKEGDKIEAGDAVADIQTDKAVVTLELEDESILAKIIVGEGIQDIKVGTLIALTVDVDEDWKSVEMPENVSVASPVTASSTTGPPSSPTSSPSSPISSPSSPPSPPSTPVQTPPGQTNIGMPALSPTMTSGTIVKWLKKEGEAIEPGDAVAEIQTDKAVMTFEIEDESILAKILVPEGSEAEIGELIAITVEKGMDWKNVVIPTITKPTAAPGVAPVAVPTTPPVAVPTAPPVGVPAPSVVTPPAPSGQVYGLAVRRLLEEYGLKAEEIKGTGRPNRLLKSDVLSYIQAKNIKKVAPKTAPPPKDQKQPDIFVKKHVPSGVPSSYQDIPVSNIRSIIAKRLGESKRIIPHSYATIDIKIDKINEIRKELKADGINISINDFITKATAHALVECPFINTLYKNDQIIQMPRVDISIAVAIESGLITPIVFDATAKSLLDISKNIKELAQKAKAGQLKPEEFQGGTFTISNLGMFGIKQFRAIINLPQTAILAVGSGQEELNAALQKVTKMSTSLSYDRRAIDEDQAADFLAVLKAMLEDPSFLIAGRLRALRYAQD
ncbi:LOW QUALITY PROTEIN: dihydrolipoyllysine-residue acetyltransferase component 1 of pyruvate dehydrogenase complex, mitochondrial [Apis florea]|uniref:LOW QUALITY PROTEIN: dihydrolipoyllysine-residue acetyltransferase component 1 of pyruvate dehydrogenase complex, mitochondrial n=1 Tax=Apis florea TaxID=7463 RepID=UPI000629C4C8|nr:LOW QUALITY PROTEIN: dihydrolipoyllysine-residue acetyltransferase component 1 of pyruvate dehydrogenase complex, mitochondrial [Apis florea]